MQLGSVLPQLGVEALEEEIQLKGLGGKLASGVQCRKVQWREVAKSTQVPDFCLPLADVGVLEAVDLLGVVCGIDFLLFPVILGFTGVYRMRGLLWKAWFPCSIRHFIRDVMHRVFERYTPSFQTE